MLNIPKYALSIETLHIIEPNKLADGINISLSLEPMDEELRVLDRSKTWTFAPKEYNPWVMKLS